MSNRYLPSITLASEILDDIIKATELEIAELKIQLQKYDNKGQKQASKVTVDVLFATMRKLTSYKEMQENLPKRSRQGANLKFNEAM